MEGTTFGNDLVVEKLKQYLEAAIRTPAGHIAIAMVGHPDLVACDVLGDITLHAKQREVLVALLAKLDGMIADMAPPAQDPALDASYHCFNMAKGPTCFDFLIWLVDAEMTRRRKGAPRPLKVGFWRGGDRFDRLDKHKKMEEWLVNVFRPLLNMIGGIEDVRACRGQQKEVYTPIDIVLAARDGELVPMFYSELAPPFPPGYITITCRESLNYPERNSNMVEWYKLALDLKKEGERVIFVRDTRYAFATMHGFDTCPEASIDLSVRCALYGHAKANLFIANGPSGLAAFGRRPYFMMIPIAESKLGVYPASTAEFWRSSADMEPGMQWPWASDCQRLVWKPDTYENLCEAWRDLKDRMPELAEAV